MKKRSRRVAKAAEMGGQAADRAKAMLRDGAMVAAGSAMAALVTYKVWNGYAWIDSKIESGIGRGLAKSAMSVTAALAYSYLVPSMPLIAAGIAAYGIFMGGMDILGISEAPQLPAPIPARFMTIAERDAFIARNPTADRTVVMARPVGPGIPARFATEAERDAFLAANPGISQTDRAAVMLVPTGPAALAYRMQSFQNTYGMR